MPRTTLTTPLAASLALLLCSAGAATAAPDNGAPRLTADAGANGVGHAGPGAAKPRPAPTGEMAQLLSAARMWEAKNRADLARGILGKALVLDPRQPDALLMLGLIELRSNRPAEADKILHQLRQAHPDDRATLELQDAYRVATRDKREMANVRLLARAGKSEDAFARLQTLFPHGAPRGELATDYYRILSGTPAGRTQAVAELRERLKEEPDDARLALVLADLLTDGAPTRQEGLAILYRITQRPDGDRDGALARWRRTLYSVGDDPAYYPWFERYLKEVPDDKVAQDTLADLGRKIEGHRRLLADPAYQARQRGLSQLERGHLGEAESALQMAYRKRADDAEVVGGLGLVRLRQGRHDEARELFARALRLDPDNRGKWSGLLATATSWGTLAQARAANVQGQPAQAETLARKALADPSATATATASARSLLADALMAQRKLPEATSLLRGMVAAREPDLGALRSLVALLRDSHREAEIGPLLDSVEQRLADARPAAATTDAVRKLRADVLSAEADQYLARGRNSPAIARLEDSLRLQPDQPWTRFTLARIYRDLGVPALGRAVMEDGLRVSAAGATRDEMRYASALYLNSVDDIDNAGQVLAQIPEAARSEGMRDLAASLAAQRLLRDARQAIAAGRETDARALLQRAAPEAKNEPQMLASIGREWIALGAPDTGLGLVRDWLAANPQDPAIAVRLRYGELLASAERDVELAAWLADARARAETTPAQRAAIDDQRLRLALRIAQRRIDEADFAAARQTLLAVPEAQQRDRRWLITLAELREAQGDDTGAAEAARRVLATQPQDAEARLTLARLFERSGRYEAATGMTRAVLADTPDDDIDTRLSIARRFTAQRREDDAAAVIEPLRLQYPERSDLTLQQGRIAQARGDYDIAATLYRESRMQEQREMVLPGPAGSLREGTPAERALGSLEQRRQGQVATGVLQSNKSGDAGISHLAATEIPLYVRIPNGYTGHAFLHADTVLLDAGTLPADSLRASATYGKIAALGNAGLAPSGQTDKGVALAAGYEFNGAYSDLRGDIGTTPLGFTEQSVVGGLRYRADMGPAAATVEVSRRPVTSSLISYAGARDPVSGESWGGVVRNGIDVRYAHDIGKGSVFASVGAGVLTGHNVLTNREFTLRAGFDYPLFSTRDQRVSSGLVGNFWHYAENQRYYTFGHGGYYSPQHYASVGVPLDWSGRHQLWSWELQGSVGWSFTYESEVPYYPTRPDLQAAAQRQLAANGLGNPVYGGGSGGGFSYTLAAAVEYRFAPRWIAGLRFQIDRSHDYAPNRAVAYLRYFFDRQKGPVPFPPTPVRPYSAY